MSLSEEGKLLLAVLGLTSIGGASYLFSNTHKPKPKVPNPQPKLLKATTQSFEPTQQDLILISRLHNVETPSVILDHDKLLLNIEFMQTKAKNNGVKLRPHIKTHKCIEIANLQRFHGSVGITCSKPGEAEEFIINGFPSITLAYPLVQIEKIEKLLKLQSEYKTDLRFVVDSEYGINVTITAAEKFNTPISLFLEIDVGLGRVGIKETDTRLLPLVQRIVSHPRLRFMGLLSHAGQAYAVQTPEAVAAVAKQEAEILRRVRKMIEREGIEVPEVSVGSTPTEIVRTDYDGITEIRPGNYVFMDRTQLSKGSITYKNISLFILATVVSSNDNYFIIDAGSKVLSSDMAPHSAQGVVGFGEVYALDDWAHKMNKMIVAKLSEEHGWVLRDRGLPPLEIGSKVCVVPNHSCSVANLTDTYTVLKENEEGPLFWKVAARGRTK